MQRASRAALRHTVTVSTYGGVEGRTSPPVQSAAARPALPPLRAAAMIGAGLLFALGACVAAGPAAAANARVRFETTEGAFLVEVHHEWAPRAAAKFQAMVRDHFFTQTRFHKLDKGQSVQFGYAALPALGDQYGRSMKDDGAPRARTFPPPAARPMWRG